MAGNLELPPFFKEAIANGRPVVTDPPKFDLDAYIANYKGRTRFDRLLLIGRTSTYLCVEALKAAVAEAKRGKDIARYEAAVESLRNIAPSDADAQADLGWIERTTKQVKVETDRLEQELKGYKNNLIKESIRMGNEDLGAHYHQIGDLGAAAKAYSRMRDYCTTHAHTTSMSFKIIQVCIEQGNWMPVQSNVDKIQHLNQREEDKKRAQPKLAAAMGLAQLASGEFRKAANSFLSTDPRLLTEEYNEVITGNDIAVYGGLCALASMDRNELQSLVLENSTYRNFLELEPHIRRAISLFCSSKYGQCLEILEAYKPDYLLDLHLQRHVPELYYAVRSKSIVQYFIPFSSVTLTAMAAAFGTTEQSVELELVDMIERGHLNARIDTQKKVLTAKRIDARATMHKDALDMAKRYQRTAHLRLLRINIINANLEVKTARNQSREQGSAYGDVLMSQASGMSPLMGKSGPRFNGQMF